MLSGGKAEGECAAQLRRTYHLVQMHKYGDIQLKGKWLCLTGTCRRIQHETDCRGAEGCVLN